MTAKPPRSEKNQTPHLPKPPILSERQQDQLDVMYGTVERTTMRMEILQALELRAGERVLEIGSGPGLLAQAIARAVGPDGKVVGIEINAKLIESSKAQCAGLPWVEITNGDVRNGLPFPDGEFDAVTAAAVMQYFSDADVDAVLAEIHRVLRPLGRVLIHDTEWDTFMHYSRDRKRMKRVLAAWRSVFANPHLFQTLSPKLRNAGFAIQRRDALPTFVPELHRNTISWDGMEFIVDMVTGRNGITRSEAEAWAEEQKQLAREGAFFSIAIRFLFTAIRVDGTV
jgi:ubiquinone/menaquinone biosynthesis C-methylase UbiE